VISESRASSRDAPDGQRHFAYTAFAESYHDASHQYLKAPLTPILRFAHEQLIYTAAVREFVTKHGLFCACAYTASALFERI